MATLTVEAEMQAHKLQEQETELTDTQAALERATRRATEVEQHAADLEKQLGEQHTVRAISCSCRRGM